MRTYDLKDDWDFLLEAKEEYAKMYEKEIEKLGDYNLGTGVACNPIVGIGARIFGKDMPSDDLQAKIKRMLPTTFTYKGQEIPVDLRIVGPVVPANESN